MKPELADAQVRCVLRKRFQRQFGCASSRKSKAFDTQLAKLHYADCTRTMAERLISDMTLKVLGCDKGHALSELRHIILQASSPG